jgi:hypothetical protein
MMGMATRIIGANFVNAVKVVKITINKGKMSVAENINNEVGKQKIESQEKKKKRRKKNTYFFFPVNMK